MTNILAVDTSTDACSVALHRDGNIEERYEVIPRQHSQRLFPLLRELLPSGDLRSQGIQAIAYTHGPGSFTGLRIAASAVQGLAFANDLPVIPISTLACQAQTALRTAIVTEGDRVLSMLDARMNEVYWALYEFCDGHASLCRGPAVCAPQKLPSIELGKALHGVGSGFTYRDSLPDDIISALDTIDADILPHARDIIPLAIEQYRRGEFQQAADVAPVYVRDEISWKKISEQGKSHD